MSTRLLARPPIPTKFLMALGLSACLSSSWAADGTAASATKPKPPSKASALLNLQDGRQGGPVIMATAGIRGTAKPASSSAYALIMTIGDYEGEIPKLKGVVHDQKSAREMAMRMGVPPANTLVYSDKQLTLKGMQQAFDDLESRLSGNEQVFIYYSGHGGRQLVKEGGQERCAESLITVDGQGFTDQDMEIRLKRLAQLTQKTIVFLDACHSGGVTTRSAAAAVQALYTPKSFSGAQNCAVATNVVTRNIVLTKKPGTGNANYVHIAAARDSEISLDQPGRGGVATQAWLSCLSGEATDLDGSGGLSASEIQVCAQQKIDAQLSAATTYLPHHVTVMGNQHLVMNYASPANVDLTAELSTPPSPAPATTEAPPAVPAPVVTVTPSPDAPVSAPPPSTPAPVVLAEAPTSSAPAAAPASTTKPPVSAAPVKRSALQALNDIYQGRDDRRLVELNTKTPVLRIGKDEIQFELNSRESGYVYILMAGSDDQTFDLLFPNELDKAHKIEAGQTLKLPRSDWALEAAGPPGRNTLLAVVSELPRDFSQVGLKRSGPFSSSGVASSAGLQQAVGFAVADPQCQNTAALRNLAVRKKCSSGYGAALLTVEEK